MQKMMQKMVTGVDNIIRVTMIVAISREWFECGGLEVPVRSLNGG